MTKIAWASDIHLDHAEPEDLERFFSEVRESGADMLVLCGDISGGRTLLKWLERLEVEIPFPVSFVLGNHDYYSSSFVKTTEDVRNAVDGNDKMIWLSDKIIQCLSGGTTALMGHEGWYDAKAGLRGRVIMNDFRYIEEMKIPYFTSPVMLHEKIAEIAEKAVQYIDDTLPEALIHGNRVVLVTHVPPFRRASKHEGRESSEYYLPYFCSVSAGEVMVKHMKAHPDKELIVLCGHTHDKCDVQILPNLKVFVAGAEYGYPHLEGVLEV